MSKSTDKLRKRYVHHPKDQLQLTFLICSHVNSSGECKILGDFVSKYTKGRHNKDRRQEQPVFKKRFRKQQEKNYVVQNAVDGIVL